MKASQINHHHSNSDLINSFRTEGLVHELSHANSTVTNVRNTEIGIAYSSWLLTFVIGCVLLIGIVICSGCGEHSNTSTYYYRVQYVTSGAKSTVIDVEPGTYIYGSYKVGDTVHVNRGDTIVTDGRYRKAVVIQILPN